MSFRVVFFGWKVAVLMLNTYMIVFIYRILSTVCIFHLLAYTYGSLCCRLRSALLLPHYWNGFAEVTSDLPVRYFSGLSLTSLLQWEVLVNLIEISYSLSPQTLQNSCSLLFLMIHFLSLMVLSLPSLPFLTFPTGTTQILFLFHFCILTLSDQSHLDSFLYADDF